MSNVKIHRNLGKLRRQFIEYIIKYIINLSEYDFFMLCSDLEDKGERPVSMTCEHCKREYGECSEENIDECFIRFKREDVAD